jgi:hypothetical protein
MLNDRIFYFVTLGIKTSLNWPNIIAKGFGGGSHEV